MAHNRRRIVATLVLTPIALAWPAMAQDAPAAFPRRLSRFSLGAAPGNRRMLYPLVWGQRERSRR